jgi:HEAT repeat protein
MNYRYAVLLLADLLTDRTKTARVAAAQALGESRAPAAIPLLRFKARTGDREPEVTAECLSALMESVPFVKEFLASEASAPNLPVKGLRLPRACG